MMKITSSILCIPPYISTTWDHINSLHIKTEGAYPTLVILLNSGNQVEIPNLPKETLNEIFESHAKFAEEKAAFEKPMHFNLPFSPDGGLGTLGTSLQHNPEQANLPPIPPDILNKVLLIARAFGLNENAFVHPEPDCHCVACQIHRALKGEQEEGETVSLEDLKFRDWEIQDKGDKLYAVTNPLDSSESYTVFLGDPIGCNCGCKNCEHIRAVLSS
jgi:hypothetical protein